MEHRYVDKFATEIWASCLQFCLPADVRVLSLVCRYFRSISQPLIFRTQRVTAPHPTVDRYNWIELTKNLHKRASFLSKLATSPHAASVRAWHFEGSLRGDLVQRHPLITNIHVLQETWLRVLLVFNNTLGSYQRLTILRLDEFSLDDTFRAALESLPLLEEVSLTECDILCRTGCLLPLKIFSLTGWRDPRPEDQEGELQLVAPQNLQRFTVGASIDGRSLLAALVGHHLPNLVRMSVTLTAQMCNLFFAFLDSCPQLEYLQMSFDEFTRDHDDHLQGPPVHPDHLPSTTLPILKSFLGPFFLAPVFIPSRPVQNVHLYRTMADVTVSQILSSLTAVSRSSVPVRALRIGAPFPPTASAEIFSVIASLFPELRVLFTALTDEVKDFPFPEFDEGEDMEDSGSVEGVDDRIVDFSEGSVDEDLVLQEVQETTISDDSLLASDSRASEERDTVVTSAAESPVAPPVLIPGYMYDASGTAHPPKLDRLEADPIPAPLSIFMDFIHNGRIVLPPRLEVLRFSQKPAWLVRTDFASDAQHQAILTLERLFPALNEVAFCGYHDSWLREAKGHIWTRDRYMGGGSRWGNHGSRIISLVWNSDGTRRDI
ncbi:hypothetical protein DFH07DRAFT_936915 [Mycena maculata]|uniref:F-box domain-containing protein n=1 Tax=Mycena maculata TaxID=230809 RepID=A0AAD7NUR6_9AGAR|nr:hypothetical protein DFH07DRAFT_374227 [Mycena maculata]KAJ7775901.1 hypothetical protein DFH07DRAFT_936915 [Mycena maculata]